MAISKPRSPRPFGARDDRRIFFLLLFFLFSLPAFSQTSSVYDAAPKDKSLLTSPQYILIDDFNSGKFLNRRLAPWQAKAPEIGALDLSLDKQDARSEQRGYSLKAAFNLLPGERASFQSFLERLDVSKAESLILKLKLESSAETAPFSGALSITLTDWKHRKAVLDITQFISKDPKVWSDVTLPLEKFQSLDLDQLFAISFTLKAAKNKIAGTLWMDEIAFYGQGDTSFESYRDNIQGFPQTVFDNARREKLKKTRNDKKLLKEIAKDTWKYFANARDLKTGLTLDHIRTGEAPLIADYTSLTNIAMDLLAIISAKELDFISQKEAAALTEKILSTLREMRRYKGFFYQFYDTKKLAITRSYISAVDSAWLAAALVVARQEFEEYRAEISKLLDSFDFEWLLDPQNNQFVVGVDVPEKEFGKAHYGILSTEARIVSLYAIGKGDVSKDQWWFVYRTPPEAWKWQNQVPKGKMVVQDGVDYFQGYYEHQGRKFVPSWGGSLFEFLMPTLIVNEKKFGAKGLGLNDKIAAELHRDYALKEKGYRIWGISPASNSNGRQWKYEEYGIRQLGVKGYPDTGIVTPHASILALEFLPKDVISNIRRFLDYEIYGEYGLYDSLNIKTGKANTQYLALDQGMILASICNHLKKGVLQKRFHEDPVGRAAQELLQKERFWDRN